MRYMSAGGSCKSSHAVCLGCERILGLGPSNAPRFRQEERWTSTLHHESRVSRRAKTVNARHSQGSLLWAPKEEGTIKQPTLADVAGAGSP